MTGFLIKGIWTETHAHRRLRSELFYKPNGTKDGQRKPEARREPWNRVFFTVLKIN